MTNWDAMKQAAARAAIAHVPEDAVVGVGTGSTVNFFIDELAKIKGRIDAAVSSSRASTERLKGAGIRVLDLNSVDDIAVYVDGADEITPQLAMIKGGVFGAVIPLVSCFFGFRCKSGAEGVGLATTNAVVVSSVSIIVLDFVMSYVFSHFY